MATNKIEIKIDKIVEDVGEIKTHMAVYNEQLKIHIRRSEALEKKIEPIEKHVIMVTGITKLIAVVGTILTIITVLIRWL